MMSSIWMGARRALDNLVQDSFCSIGDGSTVLFWWDDWLGYRIADKLTILSYLRLFLSQTISNYFFDGVWHFTDLFVTHHLSIVVDILTTPMGDREDIRYWKPSLSSDVTSQEVYQKLAARRLTVKWGSWIWSNFLPVRRSIVSWRAIRGRLPTYDALMRYGFSGPNISMLCYRNEESIDHIFWTCPIVTESWRRFLDWFDVRDLPPIYDLNSFFVFAMGVDFSPQFSNLWKLGIITLVWKLWMARNDFYFEGKTVDAKKIMVFVKAAMVEATTVFNLGKSSNSWSDYQRGRRLGITCRFAPPTSYISVTWWPPLPHWIKANTDGSASSCPGIIAAGGVFRDVTGFVRGCFHVDGGIGFACEAELLAAITAISIAHNRGWHSLWLETDSTYVEHLLKTKSTAFPWRFANS